MTDRARAAAWLVVLVVACGDDPSAQQFASFDQPNRVDFVCVLDGEPVQLEHCRNDISGNGLALHAVITQTARGEIAAMNLESGRVLDSRRDIPGFTFTPVGEMPVAVIVPPRHPALTYVADYGSRDIRVLTTSSLVSLGAGDPTLRILRLALDEQDELVVLGPDESASDRADLRVIAPTDMVLAPDEGALIMAAPDVGRVIWLPLQRCWAGGNDCQEGMIDESRIASVALQASIDLALGSTSVPVEARGYELLCDYEASAPPPVAPLELSEDALLEPPRPTALAIDGDCPDATECTPRLLVADQALPLIHAIDLDALAAGADGEAAVLAPLISGAPTISVVATPWVPATIEDGGEVQFVYAIATDGSVMVLQDGQVLSVNASGTGRPDRLAFETDAGATALAVLTPGFDVSEGADQWLTSAECTDPQQPALLRGVFLAAAHTDGQVRIADVHDMELRACRECPHTDVPVPVLVRHQPRLADNFLRTDESDPPLASGPVADPGFIIRTGALGVRTNGTTGSPDVPGLDCIACDPSLTRAFPPDVAEDPGEQAGVVGMQEDAGAEVGIVEGCSEPTPALICSDPDPLSSSPEQWRATFEGAIPRTIGGRGRFALQGSAESITGALELSAEIDFCAAGVLGEDDIAAAYEGQTCDREVEEEAASAAGIDGDQLVLVSRHVTQEVLDSLDGELATRCTALRDRLREDDAVPLGFEIRRAFRDRLVLRTALAHAPTEEVATFSDLAPCLEAGLVAFEVRALDQFVVTGSQSGFLHRVRTTTAGRCVVDPDADPLRQGRARPGCTYRNPAVQFQLHRRRGGELPTKPGTTFVANIGTPVGKLQVNVARGGFGSVNVIATQLRYNEVDRLLYLVDVHSRGLVPIQLDPVLPFVSTSYN
jgi:hypothetical protein